MKSGRRTDFGVTGEVLQDKLLSEKEPEDPIMYFPDKLDPGLINSFFCSSSSIVSNFSSLAKIIKQSSAANTVSPAE